MATTRPTALRPSMYMPQAIWLRKTTRKARSTPIIAWPFSRDVDGGRKKPLHFTAPCLPQMPSSVRRYATTPRPVARMISIIIFGNADPRLRRMIV